MLMLRLLGGASLEHASALVSGRAVQRRRLALLAILALEHPRAVSRDKLIAWLWPEHDTERARHLLRDSLYLLRSALSEEALPGAGDELRLNAELWRCDVWDFEEALAQGHPEAAARTYAGPLLDGFHIDGAPELEQWIAARRERLARAYAKALEQLAESAIATADHRGAVEWWQRLAAVEPYSARVTLRLMEALEASGDRAGAFQQARIHAQLLQQEFGAEPDPEIAALAETLRTAPRARPEPVGHEAVHPMVDELPREAISTRQSDQVETQVPVARAGSPVGRYSPRQFGLKRAALLSGLGLLVLAVALPAIVFLPPDGNALTGATVTPSTRTIAVLPCANLSGDPEQEFFSDGLSEELTGVLAQVRSLSVVARTSAFAFKGENRDIREVANRLNVGTVLECSVRRAGERVRVTAQLINAANGYHLWAQTYEREGTDIFAIQSDLALRIASALEAELTPVERERMTRRPTLNPEAHTLYQKGRFFWNQRTSSAYARAIEYYERAIEADPQYARAYAGLATVYSMQGIFSALTPERATALTRENALKALSLDPDVAEAHTVLGGYYHAHAWDSEAAEREHLRALALDPNYSTAHFWYGNFLTSMRRSEEAIAHKKKAVELDPLSPQLSWAFGISLLVARRHDEALEQFRNAIELDSMYYPAYAGLGEVHEARGRFEDAIRAQQRAIELTGGSPDPNLARVLSLAGQKEEARRMLAQFQAEAGRSGVYEPRVATVFSALGDLDGAIDWLERSYQQRHPVLRFIDGPAFARLDGDPRYLDLRRRIGLPP
jgi:TolB-like protein/DNA-binding SARP family transcriptional activator